MRLAIATSGGFHPDGRDFLTQGADGAVRLRDAEIGAASSQLMIAKSPAIWTAFRATELCVTVGEKPYRSLSGSRSTDRSVVVLQTSLGSPTDASNALVLPPARSSHVAAIVMVAR
jgi:WD40 repeat protein